LTLISGIVTIRRTDDDFLACTGSKWSLHALWHYLKEERGCSDQEVTRTPSQKPQTHARPSLENLSFFMHFLNTLYVTVYMRRSNRCRTRIFDRTEFASGSRHAFVPLPYIVDISDLKPEFSHVDLQVSDLWIRIQDVVTRTFISAEDHINTQMAVNKLHRLCWTQKSPAPQTQTSSRMLHTLGKK
jgi:hypothetical protein